MGHEYGIVFLLSIHEINIVNKFNFYLEKIFYSNGLLKFWVRINVVLSVEFLN